MNSEWKSCKIGDVVSVRRGSSPRPIKEFIVDDGMPWVKISDATSDQTRFINSTKEFIKKEGVKNSVLVNPGDLIVSNSATPGLPKFMNIQACVHDGWLVFDEYNGILKDYLYYYFIVVRGRLVNQANGSVFKNLKTDIVRDFDINLPSIETQQKIVQILSQIDEKIEYNMMINQNLESMAQAIFKDYFFKFNPFKCCEFKDSELGEIPVGWDVKSLKDVSKEIVCGKTPSTNVKEYWGEDVPFLTIPDMHNSVYVINTERYLSEKGSKSQHKKLVPPNSICVSCIATAGLVTLTSDYCHTNQQINTIVCNESISPYFLYLYMVNMSKYIEMLGSGGSTTANLNKREFSKIKIIVPPANILDNFSDMVSGLFEQIKANYVEIIKLTDLRDTLLPELMSGEIDVSNVKI